MLEELYKHKTIAKWTNWISLKSMMQLTQKIQPLQKPMEETNKVECICIKLCMLKSEGGNQS